MKNSSEPLKKTINRKNKRLLIDLMGLFARRRKRVSHFEGPLGSVLILAQEKLGDCLLLTPLLRQLRDRYPDLVIHVACFSATSSDFFRQEPVVNQVFRVKTDLWGFFRHGRRFSYDLLFNTKDHPSFNFMLQSLLVKARIKVGIAHPNHQRYFDYEISGDFYRHMLSKYLDFLQFLGHSLQPADLKPALPPVPVSPAVQTFASQLPASTVILNLSAGSPDREWTESQWGALICRLNSPLVLLAVGEQMAVRSRLEKRFSQILPCPDTKSLQEAAAILEKGRLLVSPDTSMIHLAAGAGIPVVGLYQKGDLHLARFSPWQVTCRIVQSSTLRVADIDPDLVWQAVKELCPD